MQRFGFHFLQPLLHQFPPETVHNMGLFLLHHQLWPTPVRASPPSLQVQAWGLTFTNPIGLAAGFDKNAIAIDALLRLGFGFVEAGTVTPRPQPGNPKPRIFRLPDDQAVINRLGFNNKGLDHFVAQYCNRNASLGIAGANIGRNKESTDAVADYQQGLKALFPYADYITVNISSPNTPGLRALQQREALTELIAALQTKRNALAQQYQRNVPLLLKIAPDLTPAEIEDIAEVALQERIDGLIISNTTLERTALHSMQHAQETGGLSGKPLFALSTERLRQMYRLTKGTIPLIGVGGIASADDAYQKIRAGATLVQLYTALVYQGFSVVHDICNGLAQTLERDGFKHVSEAIGIDAQ